jgi:hypothetical protein
MNFNHVVVMTGTASAGWAKAMVTEIVGGLRGLGIAATELDIDEAPEFFETSFRQRETTLVVDLNQKIRFPWRQPKVSIMVDHPCTRIRELSAPNSEAVVTGWVDASHLAAVGALGFPHRAVFLPHAGPEPTNAGRRSAERDIDLFFAGSLGEAIDRTGWRAANPGMMPVAAELIFDTIELIEKNGAPALPALVAVLGQHGVSLGSDLTRDQFAELVTTILTIGEQNRRLSVLLALPDSLNVAVASDYLPKALRDRPHIRYLGYVDDFAEIRRLMGRTRIVLNMTGKFPCGSHERIWYAMAEGAVVLTDFSVFMQETFTDGETIRYLPRKPLDAEDFRPLAALARDPGRLDRMAEAATTLYRARHTWRTRASLLRDAMALAS